VKGGYLVVMVLNKTELLDDVLKKMDELGVRGATILESVGMGRILLQDFPFYAGIRALVERTRPYNRTIFTVVRDKETLDRLVSEMDKIVRFSEPGTGILFTLPIEMAIGIPGGDRS